MLAPLTRVAGQVTLVRVSDTGRPSVTPVLPRTHVCLECGTSRSKPSNRVRRVPSACRSVLLSMCSSRAFRSSSSGRRCWCHSFTAAAQIHHAEGYTPCASVVPACMYCVSVACLLWNTSHKGGQLLQDMAVAGGEAGMVAALAGAAGVVLYSVKKHAAAPPGQLAWHIGQQLRLCHTWPVCAVAMTADGSTLAAAALGGQLFVWDLQQGMNAPQLELQVQVPSERVTSMAFSPDGARLAAAAWAGSTYLYCQHSSKERQGAPEDLVMPAPQAASPAQQALLDADIQRTLVSPVQKRADGSGQLSNAEAKSQGAEPGPSASGDSPHRGQAGEQAGLPGSGRSSAQEPEAVRAAAAHAGEAVSRLAGINHGVRG